MFSVQLPPPIFQTRIVVAGKSSGEDSFFSTYPLVQVDGVLARHHIGDGRAVLAGLGVGHLCRMLEGAGARVGRVD